MGVGNIIPNANEHQKECSSKNSDDVFIDGEKEKSCNQNSCKNNNSSTAWKWTVVDNLRMRILFWVLEWMKFCIYVNNQRCGAQGRDTCDKEGEEECHRKT